MAIFKPRRIRRYMARGLCGDGQKRKRLATVTTYRSAKPKQTLAGFLQDMIFDMRSVLPKGPAPKPARTYKVVKPQLTNLPHFEIPRKRIQ